MKKTIYSLLFILFACTVQAQTINTTALANYPKSVILRVYEVASKVSLTATEQTTIADLFQDEENDIAALVVSGATTSVIDSVRNSYKIYFNNTLSATQLADYYKVSVSYKANTTARLMAAMLKDKYNVDATMEQYFTNIYNWRESLVEKVWLRETDTAKRNNNLSNAMWAYDSLLTLYTNAAASGNYFASAVYNLDSIKHIDITKKSALATSYYNNCIQFKNKAYADNFKTALNVVFNQVADSPYYAAIYKNEIVYLTQNASQSALATYVKRDKISNYTAQQILPYLQQRERTTAIINKIYPQYTQAKDSIIDTLTFVYQTQINSLIANGSSLNNNSQIDIALYYATQLQLNEEQITNLQAALTQLNNQKDEFKSNNPNTDYDSKAFESSTLNNILSAEQYTQILTTKYYNTAINMAKQDWVEIVRQNLVGDYEETPTKTELTNYHLAVIIAYYRNANNLELQYSSVNSIKEIKPNALNDLLKKWDYKNPYNDTPDTFFQW